MCLFFFFKQKTAYEMRISDWSSDVCSSDLHRIIGRSPLLGFTDAPGDRIWIRLEPRLISVRSQVRRAHQGWRYLADEDAPPDLDGHEDDKIGRASCRERVCQYV